MLAACLACSLASWAEPGSEPATELDRARELHLRGERTEALVHYRAFLAEPGAPTADRATALNNVCVLLHDLGRVQEALESCQQALALRRRLGEMRGLSRTLNNFGLVLQSSGRYGEARAAYLEALANNRARGDEPASAVNLANLGLLAGDEGRYGLALDRHLEVEALAARHAGEPWAEEQRRVAWINLGVVYEKLGAFDQALELYHKLVAEQETQTEEQQPGPLGPRRWATVLLNLGTVYRNLGDPHQAASAYRRAAEIFERENDPAALSSARLNLGQVLYANLGRPEEAERELRRALDLSRQTGDRGVEIQALFLLGEATLERDPKSARASFARCLELAEDSGSAEGEWWARYGLGRLAAGDGDLDKALQNLEAAVEVLERTRSRVDDRDLRGGFFAGWRHVYEAAVDVLWRRSRASGDAAGDHAREAFSLVQRAKQRELAEALGGPGGTTDGAMDLAPLRAALDASGATGEAALVEYFFTVDSLFAFRIGTASEDLRWWRHDASAAADASRSALAVHAALAAAEPPPAGEVRRLAELLGPAWDDGDVDRLVLAPDGALRYLPFELLPASPGSAELLVKRSLVSYLPSASALRSAERSVAEPRFAFVGLADPAVEPAIDPATDPEEADPLATLRTGLFTSRFALERLPSGRREIEDAARRLPGEHLLLTGRQATETALRRVAGEGSRVIHLAAHTVIDERPGGGAAVLLAPSAGGADRDAEERQANDGLLGPADLARLDLRTRLTVLAACRTALPPPDGAGPGGGRGSEGSAFGSLTGSFLAAGSDSVLATLWDVGDEATEAFMQQLYFELGRGLEPARALAEVKRRMAHDPSWSAPHLWSAYVLVGDAEAVAPAVAVSARSRWQIALAVVGVAVLAGLAFAARAALRRRRPRRTSG